MGLRVGAPDFSCFYVFIKHAQIHKIYRGGGGINEIIMFARGGGETMFGYYTMEI